MTPLEKKLNEIGENMNTINGQETAEKDHGFTPEQNEAWIMLEAFVRGELGAPSKADALEAVAAIYEWVSGVDE